MINELRVIGDHLGAIRDLLALISRQMEPATGARVSDAIVRLIEGDPHQFSTRPCQTCRTVSALANEAFGCERKRKP